MVRIKMHAALKNIMTQTKKQRVICLIIFILYILTVLYLTIFRFNFRYSERKLNLTLFVSLIKVFRNADIGEFLRLFLGNIGWFVPFGFLLPILLKRNNPLIIIGNSLLFSIFIEVIQFISYKGIAELDDLILNTLGAIIGYLLYWFLRRLSSTGVRV